MFITVMLVVAILYVSDGPGSFAYQRKQQYLK